MLIQSNSLDIANKEVRDIDPGRTRTMRLGSDFSAVGEQDARLRECGDGSAGTNANVYVRGPTHPAGRLFVGLVRGRSMTRPQKHARKSGQVALSWVFG